MKESAYNITLTKLAEIVNRPENSFSITVRKIMNEWYEAGICPKIYRGEVIE